MTQDKITEIINTLEKHSPDETSELGEAIVSAVEMLKREIPRKVDTEITEIGGVQHVCQSCWGFVGYLHEHCENCGQKLDWED